MHVDGQCHCGAIAYEAEVEPGSVMLCNCRDCQRQSGSVFRTNVPAPAETFRITRGTPRLYIKTADSGHKRAHAFCGNCGSPIYASAPMNPTSYSLRVGSLNQAHQLGGPHRQIWTRSRFAWLPPFPDVPGVEGQP